MFGASLGSKMSGLFGRGAGWLEPFNNWCSLLGGFLLLAMMLLVSVAVFMRYVLRSPLIGTDQIAGWFMLYVIFLGAAYTLQVEGHIRVDVILRLLGERKQAVVNLVAMIYGCLFPIILFLLCLGLAQSALIGGWLTEYDINIPAFAIYVILPVGSLLLLLQFGRTIHGLYGKTRHSDKLTIQDKAV